MADIDLTAEVKAILANELEEIVKNLEQGLKFPQGYIDPEQDEAYRAGTRNVIENIRGRAYDLRMRIRRDQDYVSKGMDPITHKKFTSEAAKEALQRYGIRPGDPVPGQDCCGGCSEPVPEPEDKSCTGECTEPKEGKVKKLINKVRGKK